MSFAMEDVGSRRFGVAYNRNGGMGAACAQNCVSYPVPSQVSLLDVNHPDVTGGTFWFNPGTRTGATPLFAVPANGYYGTLGNGTEKDPGPYESKRSRHYHICRTLANGRSSWSEIQANSGQTLNGWLQVARNVTGDLYLFALDANGNVWSNWQSTPSGGWQTTWSELPIPAAAIQPGFVAGQNDSGRFELFGVGSDTNVYHMWITTSGTWTTRWVSIGTAAGGLDPHLVVSNTNDGRLQVFGVNSSGIVYSNWQQTAGGAWQSSWASMGNTTELAFYNGQP